MRVCCLIALHRSRPFLPSQLPSLPLLWRNEVWPRRSAERSRVAGAPRGPGSVRLSRPRRQWGIGAPAISRRHGPCARGCTASGVLPWFASPASVWTCARFTVVCAVGMAPPHDGHSRGWPSKVSNAVQDGRNSSHRMAAPTSPAGTSRASEDRRNTQEACRSTHGRPSRGVTRTVQAAAGTAARGSKSVPVFHIACRITASLRASATAARLKPTWVFRARAQRRSVLSLCTRVRIETAAS
jgi:hypothetical protein